MAQLVEWAAGLREGLGIPGSTGDSGERASGGQGGRKVERLANGVNSQQRLKPTAAAQQPWGTRKWGESRQNSSTGSFYPTAPPPQGTALTPSILSGILQGRITEPFVDSVTEALRSQVSLPRSNGLSAQSLGPCSVHLQRVFLICCVNTPLWLRLLITSILQVINLRLREGK